MNVSTKEKYDIQITITKLTQGYFGINMSSCVIMIILFEQEIHLVRNLHFVYNYIKHLVFFFRFMSKPTRDR